VRNVIGYKKSFNEKFKLITLSAETKTILILVHSAYEVCFGKLVWIPNLLYFLVSPTNILFIFINLFSYI